MRLSSLLAIAVATAFSNEGDPTEQIKTVMIQTDNGPVRINAHDFDESSMTLADVAPVDPTPAPPVIPAETAAVARSVAAVGTGTKRRFFIVGSDGSNLAGDGIDPAGYATDADAWAAITAINLAEQGAS